MPDWMTRLKLFERSADKACRFVSPEDLVYHTCISLKYNYLYVVTPKVACSTVKKLLIRAEYEGKTELYPEPEHIHYMEFSSLLNARQVGDFEAFSRRRDIFKFCFVRNPFTGLLSCYRDKVRHRKPESKSLMIQLGYGRYSEEVLSFSAFVEAVVAQPVRFMNPHWRPPYYVTFQNGIVFDFIGRFEQFEKDLRQVTDRIGIDPDRYYLPQKGHATGASGRLAEFYTPEIQEKVIPF